MRKPVLIFLLLLPLIAAGQTAMVLRLSVRRIAVTQITYDKCEDQPVLFFTKGDILGLLTPDDTLQLKRVLVQESEPGRSTVLCQDQLHGNQPYRVRFIEGEKGILMYITPLIVVPKQDQARRALLAAPITPARRVLYGLVLSSIPCN